ncbi:kelch-like [Perkinsus olseni]|uniref:Kelch-like n=1 Tax=Perkinsus olseni TaxID=32597 RepID=A0A7J6RXF0_PEROL|nr:kelch-like [Perkinsus olseni]
MLTRRPFIRFLSCGIRRMSSARGHDINPKKPPPGVHQVEKLISSTVEGVGSLMNETLLVGKILSQAAGREAQAAVHDAGDSMQKRLEDYLSSPEALEQLGDKRVELIREQVRASRELLDAAATFLKATSESSLESSVEVLNKSLSLMEVPILVLGPQAKRDREIEHRIISTLSPKASAGGGSSAVLLL